MKAYTQVLPVLARMYGQSSAGRHGGGRRDFQPDLEVLLANAQCGEGDLRELAERDLRAAQEAGLLILEPIHPRDPHSIAKVRLPPASEAEFYRWLGLPSPTQQREAWANLFFEAINWPVPERFTLSWRTFCAQRAKSARTWSGMKYFGFADLVAGRLLLELLARLLAWNDFQLIRWVSSVLCGDSKALEGRQKTLESLLVEASGGAIDSLQALGIQPVPAGVTFHGPLRLRIGEQWRDFSGMHGPTTLSEADMDRVSACECPAIRCLSVENATPFHALAQLQSGELLILTSYPNHATLRLLHALNQSPRAPEFWHFGDTDPSGFHILADLRQRSQIAFRAFAMEFRPDLESRPLSEREAALAGELRARMPDERLALESMLASGRKGRFEQESLRPPDLPHWPYWRFIEQPGVTSTG